MSSSMFGKAKRLKTLREAGIEDLGFGEWRVVFVVSACYYVLSDVVKKTNYVVIKRVGERCEVVSSIHIGRVIEEHEWRVAIPGGLAMLARQNIIHETPEPVDRPHRLFHKLLTLEGFHASRIVMEKERFYIVEDITSTRYVLIQCDSTRDGASDPHIVLRLNTGVKIAVHELHDILDKEIERNCLAAL